MPELRKHRKRIAREDAVSLAFLLRVVYPAEEGIGSGTDGVIDTNGLLIFVEVVSVLERYANRIGVAGGLNKRRCSAVRVGQQLLKCHRLLAELAGRDAVIRVRRSANDVAGRITNYGAGLEDGTDLEGRILTRGQCS